MQKKDFSFNLDVDLMARKDFEKIVVDLRNIIFADLDLSFNSDVSKFLRKNYPFLSKPVRDGIIEFFYAALSVAYDKGGLAACDIIFRHLLERGDQQ